MEIQYLLWGKCCIEILCKCDREQSLQEMIKINVLFILNLNLNIRESHRVKWCENPSNGQHALKKVKMKARENI